MWLAPMAGVSVRAFREWHRRAGAGLTHTEMVSAVGLLRGGEKTASLLGGDDERGPTALQLFAPDAESIVRGAEIALARRSFDALEINMACPMPKVMKRGSGAALLDRRDEAAEMIAQLKRLGLPVWAKIRIAEKRYGPGCTDAFCEALLDAGAALVMVHGRTPSQRYEGSADRAEVLRLARKYRGAIFASGDVFEPSDAAEYISGGCVGALAARGAVRDAYLIPRANALLGLDVQRCMSDPSAVDQLRALREIGELGVRYGGERSALILVKRMLGGMVRGFSGAAEARRECSICCTWLELSQRIDRLEEMLACAS